MLTPLGGLVKLSKAIFLDGNGNEMQFVAFCVTDFIMDISFQSQ